MLYKNYSLSIFILKVCSLCEKSSKKRWLPLADSICTNSGAMSPATCQGHNFGGIELVTSQLNRVVIEVVVVAGQFYQRGSLYRTHLLGMGKTYIYKVPFGHPSTRLPKITLPFGHPSI